MLASSVAALKETYQPTKRKHMHNKLQVFIQQMQLSLFRCV